MQWIAILGGLLVMMGQNNRSDVPVAQLQWRQ